MPENHHSSLKINMFKMNKLHFGDLDVKCGGKRGFPSCATEKDSFIFSQRRQIPSNNEKSIQADTLLQNQNCIAIAVAVIVS